MDGLRAQTTRKPFSSSRAWPSRWGSNEPLQRPTTLRISKRIVRALIGQAFVYLVGKELQTFLDFPPMQKGASLNLDAVKAEMSNRMAQAEAASRGTGQ